MQGSWKVQLRQKLKNMRRPAETTTSKKRTQEDTPSCSSSEATDDGTCTPSAKRKCTNHCNLDPSDDEVGDMEKLEQTLQEDRPNRKYVKQAMKTTYRARRKWILEDCPPVSETLRRFPILKTTKYVRILHACLTC